MGNGMVDSRGRFGDGGLKQGDSDSGDDVEMVKRKGRGDSVRSGSRRVGGRIEVVEKGIFIRCGEILGFDARRCGSFRASRVNSKGW